MIMSFLYMLSCFVQNNKKFYKKAPKNLKKCGFLFDFNCFSCQTTGKSYENSKITSYENLK